MVVIYLDSLVLLNLILDYLLLLLAGRIAGEALCRWRIFLGAILGAIYAGATIWPGWPFLLHPVVRAAAGIIMVLTAYPVTRRFFRLLLLFFALTAGSGGGLYALSFLNLGVGQINGIPVPLLDIKYILLFTAAAYCLLSLVCRGMAHHSPEELRNLTIRTDRGEARLTALVDNGNTLQDPMTGKGVIVAEGACLSSLLPPQADCNAPARCFPLLPDPKRFRLLPFRSVGVDQGLLLAMRADAVLVNGKDLGSRLVALSPNPVSDGGAYQALLCKE